MARGQPVEETASTDRLIREARTQAYVRSVISSVFLRLCVPLAVAPPRRGGVPGFLLFIYSFLASELPFLPFYYIVESTVQGAVQNNVNTPMGWARRRAFGGSGARDRSDRRAGTAGRRRP